MNPPLLIEVWKEAVAHHQAGRLIEAEQHYRKLLQLQPHHGDAMHLLGVLLGQSKRPEEALPFLLEAVRLQPTLPAFWNNLGEVYRQQKDWNEAVSCFRRALAIAPGMAEAHFNLGNVFREMGQLEEAIVCFRAATEKAPRYAKAFFNLGNALRTSGRGPWSIDAYRRALALKADWPELLENLGTSLLENGNTEEAFQCFQRLRGLAPNHAELDAHFGGVYLKRGEIELARQSFERSLCQKERHWLSQFRVDILAELIPESNESIDAYRHKLTTLLDEYQEKQDPPDLNQLGSSGAEPPMALAYQGREDLPIKQAYSRLFSKGITPLSPRGGDEKPHVGVVVTHGHEGVFARCLGGLVERLSPNRLKVSLVSNHAGANILRHLLPRYPHEMLILPDSLLEAAQTIEAAKIDLLHYWEVGTDSTNYFLPYFKPAPVQSATWGWPVTTGIPQVDYYVSSRILEPDDADGHYTENLVQLPSLPTYYERPIACNTPRPDRWGIPDRAPMLLCTQNLRKYHPDFDAVLAQLLSALPTAWLVVIGDEQERVTERLLARWRKCMPAELARVRVVGRMNRPEYLDLVAAADLMLDTPHYGGGANSIFDAIAVGTPFVTWIGRFHRGRWATGVLTVLGLQELAVPALSDYVTRATNLLANSDYLQRMRKTLMERSDILFQDAKALRELEEWFVVTIEKKRSFADI